MRLYFKAPSACPPILPLPSLHPHRCRRLTSPRLNHTHRRQQSLPTRVIAACTSHSALSSSSLCCSLPASICRCASRHWRERESPNPLRKPRSPAPVRLSLLLCPFHLPRRVTPR